MVRDPREKIIRRKYKKTKNILVVSPKGGVGKTLISCALSYYLKSGLLDCDLYSPSCHKVFGLKKFEIKEEKGVIPLKVRGISFFSPVLFSKDRAFPLRYAKDCLLEILSLPNWDKDIIVFDTPPGLGEVILELLRLIEKKIIILVIKKDILSLNSAKKFLEIEKVDYVIENFGESKIIKELCEKNGIKYLGGIPFYENLDINNFFETQFLKDFENIFQRFKEYNNTLFNNI